MVRRAGFFLGLLPTSKTGRREAVEGFVCVLPWICGFVAFVAGPMVASVYISLNDWPLVGTMRWVGLQNYREALASPITWQALKVTTLYAFISVPLSLVGALAIALLMNQKVRGILVFRTIYYLPSVISGVAVAMLWIWIFNPEFGVLNELLELFGGIRGPAWLNDERWALPALIIMSLWGLGGGMLIYLAGLQGIPSDLYEAATIDGAGAWRKFLAVTIPMMTPVIFFNLVMGIIGSLQTFTQSLIMTNGGPHNATLFFVLLIYKSAFVYFKMGYASALAWILFVYILILTFIVFRTSGWVYYSGEVRGR